MMQLSPENAELQILADCETEKAVSLKELVPDWWGKSVSAEAEAGSIII